MKLQQYKNGKVSEDELEQITEQLVIAKFDADYKNKWSKILEKEHGISRKAKNPPRWFFFSKMAAAVLVFILLSISVLYQWNKNIPHQVDALIAADHFVNKEGGKKGQETLMQIREEATLAFNEQQYALANDRYQQIVLNGDAEKSDYFYQGYCWLKLGDAEQSIQALEKAKSWPEDQGNFREEINWYLCLALLKAGNTEQAKINLSAIAPDDWHYSEAQALLEKL